MDRTFIIYASPECECCEEQLAGLICDSPIPGESEQVDYEDWVI